MPKRIHPTALVDPGAELADDVEIAPFTIIGPDVRLADGVKVGPHAVLEGWTTIGEGTEIGPGAVIGAKPQDYTYHAEQTFVEIGKHCLIREYATVHRGTIKGGGITRIGNACFLMAYTHVAHDCQIGNGVLLANSIAMAGHVTIGDHANISGLVTIHQHVKIGTCAMVGGSSRIPKDIPPYALAAGIPVKIYGLHVVGLKRQGFSRESMNALEKAYKLLFSSELNVSQALEKIPREIVPMTVEVQHLVDFVKNSKRGISR